MTTSVTAESINKHYPTRGEDLVVLKDVSLTLEAGDSAVIMGPSGSGKSTFLNIVGTLETPSNGHVTIEETDPFRLSETELARFRNRRIGFIFQEHHLLPQCTALENVLVPTLAAPGEDDDVARARTLLDRVGLGDRLDHRPGELSGGERQRVAIARSLVNRPAVVLADEPTGNLDQATADKVAALLFELHREEHVTLLAVTHSELLAGRFARRFELSEGTLIQR